MSVSVFKKVMCILMTLACIAAMCAEGGAAYAESIPVQYENNDDVSASCTLDPAQAIIPYAKKAEIPNVSDNSSAGYDRTIQDYKKSS